MLAWLPRADADEENRQHAFQGAECWDSVWLASQAQLFGHLVAAVNAVPVDVVLSGPQPFD